MKYIKIISPFIALWIFTYLLHITPKGADYILVPLIITGMYSIFILFVVSLSTLSSLED